MQQDILIIGLLFPAIPLVMLSMLLFTRVPDRWHPARRASVRFGNASGQGKYLKPKHRRRVANKN